MCFFKQKTAYEMRISDWSSDVCSSDLDDVDPVGAELFLKQYQFVFEGQQNVADAALHEGRGRAAATGIEYRHVLQECGDEGARLGIVAAGLRQRVLPGGEVAVAAVAGGLRIREDRKSTRLNSSH